MALIALFTSLFGGCDRAPIAPTPPSAVRVNEALQKVRDAGSGRYEARILQADASASNVWTVGYDLARHAYAGKIDVHDREGNTYTYEKVATSTRSYARTSVWMEQHGDRWEVVDTVPPDPATPTRTRELEDAGVPPHLLPFLSFRASLAPDAVRAADDAWLVTGSVPLSHGLSALTMTEPVAPETAYEREEAVGTAPAVLVLGPDLGIRELRLDGDAVAHASGLSDDLIDILRGTKASIQLENTGQHVDITLPRNEQVIQAPTPTG